MSILVVLLSLLEGLSRLAILIRLGDSTAGLSEKNQHLKYHPFTMYGPDWDERIAKFTDQQSLDGVCRVALLGGSTAEGWDPKEIEKKLNAITGARRSRVINLGTGGFNARQQAIVAALWLPKLKPHLIITLDGANDIIHRPRMKKGGTFYLNDTYQLFLSSPYFSPLWSTLINSQLFNSISSLQRRVGFKDKPEFSDLTTYYLDAQKSIDSIAKGIGSKRIYILQPFHSFKNRMSLIEKRFKHYDYRKSYVTKYYNILGSELLMLSNSTGNIFIDGRLIFARDPSYIFIDDVHLTKQGYAMLGDYLATTILTEGILDHCD